MEWKKFVKFLVNFVISGICIYPILATCISYFGFEEIISFQMTKMAPVPAFSMCIPPKYSDSDLESEDIFHFCDSEFEDNLSISCRKLINSVFSTNETYSI